MATVARSVVMAKVQALISAMVFSSPIGTATRWITVENKLRLWADVPPEQQPYACLLTHGETDDYPGLGTYRRRLNLQVWCYSRSDNSVGQTDLDTMMEAFEKVFNTVDNFSSGSNTLGGIVEWCRIQGKVFKDPGDIDSQTLLIVPLVVEIP